MICMYTYMCVWESYSQIYLCLELWLLSWFCMCGKKLVYAYFVLILIVCGHHPSVNFFSVHVKYCFVCMWLSVQSGIIVDLLWEPDANCGSFKKEFILQFLLLFSMQFFFYMKNFCCGKQQYKIIFNMFCCVFFNTFLKIMSCRKRKKIVCRFLFISLFVQFCFFGISVLYHKRSLLFWDFLW